MFHGELECLVDSGTTHTILRNRQLFVDFVSSVTRVSTMTGSDNIIKGRGIAQFLMPNGTMIKVDGALYAPRAPRTLLSFKVVRDNDLHFHTYVEDGIEYLLITSTKNSRTRVVEKCKRVQSGIYFTTIRAIESHAVVLCDTDSYRLWHDRLGHPGRDLMIRILKCSHGHPFFKSKKRKHDGKDEDDPETEFHVLGSASPPKPPATSRLQGEVRPDGSLPPSVNATVAISNAHRSFCKACSLAKLTARPSFCY